MQNILEICKQLNIELSFNPDGIRIFNEDTEYQTDALSLAAVEDYVNTRLKGQECDRKIKWF